MKLEQALALAAVVGAVSVGSASAATLTVIGGVDYLYGQPNYDGSCAGGDNTTCYNPSGTAENIHPDLKAFYDAGTYPGLSLSGPAQITVEFIGKEAGAVNTAFSVGGGSILNTDAIGTMYSFFQDVGGTLNFSFASGLGSIAGSEGFSGGAGVAFSFCDACTLVYAYFDDSGAGEDRDWDDMVVKITVDAVPVPAAGFMLLGGLGGLAALRRRRKTA
jgi:hypothetical protein